MINGPFDFDMDEMLEAANDTMAQFEDLVEDQVADSVAEDSVDAYDGEGN